MRHVKSNNQDKWKTARLSFSQNFIAKDLVLWDEEIYFFSSPLALHIEKQNMIKLSF